MCQGTAHDARDVVCGLLADGFYNMAVAIVVAFDVTRRDMRTEMRASVISIWPCSLAGVGNSNNNATKLERNSGNRQQQQRRRPGQMSRTIGRPFDGSIFKEISEPAKAAEDSRRSHNEPLEFDTANWDWKR